MDQIIGDPYNIPHPIRYIGNLISVLEKRLLGKTKGIPDRNAGKEKRRGVLLWFIVTITTCLITFLVLFAAYIINRYLGLAIEAILTCYRRSLRKEIFRPQDTAFP